MAGGITIRRRRVSGGRAAAAFTLVELLVVIAIVAVLAALFIPGVERARRAAHGATCRGNLRQIGVAMMAYSQDNNGQLPFWGEPRARGWPAGIGADESSGAQWPHQIMRYLGMDWEWGRVWPPPELGNRPTVFFCPGGQPWDPSRSRAVVESLSYNYNQRVGQNINNSRQLSRLVEPQVTFLVADAHAPLEDRDFICHAPTWIGRGMSGFVRFQESTLATRGCFDRHNDNTHVLFASGHVEARPRDRTGRFIAGINFRNNQNPYEWP